MLIQAHFPRDSVGRHVAKAWMRLLPHVNPVLSNGNNHYSLPSGSILSDSYRGRSLLPNHKYVRGKRVKDSFFDDSQREILQMVLTRDIGLGTKIARILTLLSRTEFMRIEEFISGFVDSLWLADHRYFYNHDQTESSTLGLIKFMVRKIFGIGASNRKLLVDLWKEFTNFLFHTAAHTRTIGGPPPKPRQGNLFARLLTIPNINRLLEGVGLDNVDYCRLAHLTSTRQMPYMGSETERLAKDAFSEVVSSTEGMASDKYVAKMRLASARLGRICRNINRSRPIQDETAHISVNSSGERTHSVKDGGVAQAVREAMDRILTVVHDKDFTEDTPFGPAVHRAGIPVWKTLFRTEDEYITVSKQSWLAQRELIKNQEGRFWGLDSSTGKQIMYCAWKEISDLPELRAEVVPEMGNKARIVTISDYWLNVIQEPLAHLLIEALRFHPSVFSSFSRMDQAWAATEMVAKVKYDPEHHWVLSSDLKDATNAQQFELTKSLIRGFLAGYGEIVRPSYLELVLSTIGPRLVSFRGYEHLSVLTTKGIMMGEAIAKPSLTLLNLSIEELSFLEFTKTEDRLYNTDESPYRNWRCCHIGGDDHLAVGPLGYLEGITRNHGHAGSHIAAGKHGYSRSAVKYTEKILNIENFRTKDPNQIIVDSVKVRLLERGLSTLMAKDNKNVAVGKSAQLARTIEWLPEYCYPPGKIQSIRNLFIKRMGPLLPREHSNPKAFAAIHLPPILGGYGLGGRELKKYLKASPEPHQRLLSKMMLGITVTDELALLRKLNHNPSTRGVESIDQYELDLANQINALASQYGCISWTDFQEKFRGANNRITIANGYREGWMSVSDFAKRVTRGTLFQHLLMGTAKAKEFQTVPWVQTYRNIWNRLMDLVGPYDIPDWDRLTDKQLNRLVNSCNKVWYIDSCRMNTFDLGVEDNSPDGEHETYDFVQAPWLFGARIGMPDLSVGKHFVGWRGEPRTKFRDHFDEDDSDEDFDEDASLIHQLMATEFGGLTLPTIAGLESDEDDEEQ